jgi:hypothetical protein
MAFYSGPRFSQTAEQAHQHSGPTDGGDTINAANGAFSDTLFAESGFQLTNGPLVLPPDEDTVSGNKNNYNPAGAAGTDWVMALLNVTGAFNVTGLDATFSIGSDAASCAVILVNEGSGTATFKNASASSTAANRFSMGSDQTLAPGQAIAFWYDAVASRWRLLWAAGGSSALADHQHTATGDGGATVAPTSLTAAGVLVLSNIITPTLSASQNNWAPAGIGAASVVAINPSGGTWHITGISAGQVAGSVLILQNVDGTLGIVLDDGSASSTAANRIHCPGAANLTIRAHGSVMLVYAAGSGGTFAWRVVSP